MQVRGNSIQMDLNNKENLLSQMPKNFRRNSFRHGFADDEQFDIIGFTSALGGNLLKDIQRVAVIFRCAAHNQLFPLRDLRRCSG